MDFISWVKCNIFGCHQWHYTKPHYRSPYHARLYQEETPALRECSRCWEFQIREKEWKNYPDFKYIWKTCINKKHYEVNK